MATASAKKTVKATNGKTAPKKKFDLHEALHEHFGFEKFKGIRKRSLNHYMPVMIRLLLNQPVAVKACVINYPHW